VAAAKAGRKQTPFISTGLQPGVGSASSKKLFFRATGKPLKRLAACIHADTRLKPGANERGRTMENKYA
jgi:hypothetical protein